MRGLSNKKGGKTKKRKKLPHLGYWQCIDPLDGELVTISIIKDDPGNKKDETFTLRLARPFFRTCGGTPGKIVADMVLNEAGNLITTNDPVTVRCFAEDRTSFPVIETSAVLAADDLEFSHEPYNDILQFTFVTELNCHRLSPRPY
eukprot:CAMPEP_0168844836 /NCGR_PEP_ID=MMETSP0727-20121128/8956_1 /TAXON_ID=265536 /ORGANISM="Amphiprora sp., Strain CCMP467" /LENGTH=145 /DNA_ID=CAMNT_0008898519 /DNA_START=120 /DNA_END=557 /DNA_ORIENTATION=-